jgi:hypothetical protein
MSRGVFFCKSRLPVFIGFPAIWQYWSHFGFVLGILVFVLFLVFVFVFVFVFRQGRIRPVLVFVFFIYMFFSLRNHSFVFFSFRSFCDVSYSPHVSTSLYFNFGRNVGARMRFDSFSFNVPLYTDVVDVSFSISLRVSLGSFHLFACFLHFMIVSEEHNFLRHYSNVLYFTTTFLFHEFITRSRLFFFRFFCLINHYVQLDSTQLIVVHKFVSVLMSINTIITRFHVLVRSNGFNAYWWSQYFFRCSLFLVDCSKLFYVLRLMQSTKVSGDFFFLSDFHFNNMDVLLRARFNRQNDIVFRVWGVRDCVGLHDFNLRVFDDRVSAFSRERKARLRAIRNSRYYRKVRSVPKKRQQ